MPDQYAPTQLLRTGDPAPRFFAHALSGNENYRFDLAAGRHLLLLFFGSAVEPASAAALQLVAQHRAMFDDDTACFFGITTNPQDTEKRRIAQSLPGIRFFLDYDSSISALYGAAPINGSGTADAPYLSHWLLLDPQLRVVGRYEIDRGSAALKHLAAIKDADKSASWAPVLSLPNILEPKLCAHLVKLYEEHGGSESGFMRDENGETMLKIDRAHKVRSDCIIEDKGLREMLVHRIFRRIIPEIQRAFQFSATRVERYIVACYDAESGGHFRPHRDNTTKGTAHRRFAVTINLNAEDYEGGDLRFPEFGNRTYRAPTGGAVIFSCSLLHEATPVTNGRRYAFLPFLYDEDGARIRLENNKFLGEGVSAYKG